MTIFMTILPVAGLYIMNWYFSQSVSNDTWKYHQFPTNESRIDQHLVKMKCFMRRISLAVCVLISSRHGEFSDENTFNTAVVYLAITHFHISVNVYSLTDSQNLSVNQMSEHLEIMCLNDAHVKDCAWNRRMTLTLVFADDVDWLLTIKALVY